ncbi:M20/M25/M40 family metallo-hydrolase [Nocardia goodfellowii]|uniref:Carboxypeptidase PM20D1 n=1 Tax=Nocardia goodfellowii TaxID=882446 RepID=A0ABS4QRZ2_9NOCA|nr:M20/M25/M40 family metallo-hydrolase [Nocardia goodfellowii]MBP2193868.1 carboxypeptidase PM20D1 [Nocardia goodfellowii]
MSSRTEPVSVPVDDVVAERLAVAIRCVTISGDVMGSASESFGARGGGAHLDAGGDMESADTSDAEFAKLAAHLEHSFPRVHAELELQTFGRSRLYRWAGTEPEKVAAVLLAHQDVVPVDDAERWTHPPFAGVVDDEFIWGRGAIDDKSRVLAILEALEMALTAGVRPTRTIYLAFGHDEEVFGDHGAVLMARHLRDRNVRADLLLDEGGVITQGVADGVDIPVATIMVGEKGYVTVRLSVWEAGGHSSMPGRQTAVGRLARAVARLQDNPMPMRLIPVIADMLERLRHTMAEPRRSLLKLSGKSVVAPLITRIMAAGPTTEALVRTTTAPTVIRGGVKANVLPQRAEALVNFRILPGDSVAKVLEHCRKVVRDDGVHIEIIGTASEPSLDPRVGPSFDLVARLAQAVVPGIAVTTGLVPGATDSRHYDDLAVTRCNFAPIMLTQADIGSIHGTDERISRLNYARLIEFNRLLLTELARDTGPALHVQQPRSIQPDKPEQ